MRRSKWPKRSQANETPPRRRFSSPERLRLTENQIVVATGLGMGTIYGLAVAFGGFHSGGGAVGPVRFSTVSACAYAGYDEGLCEGGYAAAVEEHGKSAPRFESLTACEAEWGSRGCTTLADGSLRLSAMQPAGSLSHNDAFVPVLTGFVLSPMMQRKYESTGTYGGGSAGLPIYRDRRGADVALERGSGGKMVAKPVNVRTATVVQSGFGGRGMSGGRRGFGG